MGTILRNNTGSWAPVTGTTNKIPTGVWAARASDVSLVGEGGVIQRTNQGSFSDFRTTPTVRLNAVGGTGANNLLAVGDGGNVLRYVEGGWYRIQAGTTLWVVGNSGTIRQWNGSTWMSHANPNTGSLFSI